MRRKQDKGERKHRRTWKHSESVATMANADFSQAPSLSEAMGLDQPKRCIHGGRFPCAQCLANRRCNEHATGKKLTEVDFDLIYSAPTEPGNSLDSACL